MAKLIAGTVRNLIPDTLAGAMDGEFVQLWNQENEIALPNEPKAIADRRLMFVAIARGMLGYLHDNLDKHDHQLEFEWE